MPDDLALAAGHALALCADPMFLRDLWYLALPSRRLRAGRMQRVRMLDEPVVVGRTKSGEPFALRDLCPHRGIPLSDGRVVGEEVECAYHGWRFETGGGRCTLIPSLVADQAFETERIAVRRYPCREVQGNLWVYMAADTRPDGEPLTEPPVIPEIGDLTPRHAVSMTFPCNVDHAVIGLMDPAHGPFVHRAWWWRSAKSIHDKAKAFAPSDLGFTMVRHRPSSNSAAYKLVRGEVSTEIAFRLPGVRIEHVRAGEGAFCGLTAITPIDENSCRVHHAVWWTIPWLAPLKLVMPYFARQFLGQDRNIVRRQARGLAEDPSLMLINDADVQAKWYYRLKREWARSREENRRFINPVQARTLRWRS